jgi:hypothetical protein
MQSKKLKVHANNIQSIHLANCHLSIHARFQHFIAIISSKSYITNCLHLPRLTVEQHTQTIRGTCITVAKSQSYVEDH